MSTIRTVLDAFSEGARAFVRGRVMARRQHGSVAFIDLDDRQGKIQIIVSKDSGLPLPNLGDLVAISGTCCLSRSGTHSLSAESLETIVRCDMTIPDKRTLAERAPRHLELLVDDQRFEFFAGLSRFTFALRSHLYGEQYLEFDTATLQRRFNAGFARPFATTVNATGRQAYLRLTSELRLKQLMVAGYERVFEMGKSFRNEGIDKMHHPEFTQLELYQAYTDLEGIMSTVEALLKRASSEAFGRSVLSGPDAWLRVDLLGRCRDVFGSEFSYSLPKTTLLALGDAHLPEGKSLSPESSVPQLYMDLIRKAVFPTVSEPSFLVGFPALASPLTRRSSAAPDSCEKAALVVAGRRVCDLACEENDLSIVARSLEEQSALTGRQPDQEFLDALRIGIPPMAGAGLGIERTALLAAYGGFDRPVSDAIPFPLRS